MQADQGEVGMQIEFLLEERSAEVVLEIILPKILPDDVDYTFHVSEGKHDLLKNLPTLLKGFGPPISNNRRIMVLIDEDREDCFCLKAQLEEIAHDAGFVTKSSASQEGDFQVVNRLAIEELEAWFFGDINALRNAYPRVSRNAQVQDPDAIENGTSEALWRALRRYYPTRLPKTKVAQNIAHHMEPCRNTSRSFQVFIEGLKACVGEHGLRNQ